MVFNATKVTLWMTLRMNKFTNIFMDDERVHPLARTLPSLGANL